MTHTPGPWIMVVGENACFHEGNRVSIISDTKVEGSDEILTQTICEVWPGDNDCDIKDGRLLVAAPDLLLVSQEADTLSQNIAELLRDYAVEDRWMADLLTQAVALGENARAAIARTETGS